MKPFVAVGTVALLLSIPSLKSAPAQSAGYTFTPIAKVGDLPPGDEPFRFSQFSGAQVNNAGDVLVAAHGLYLVRQGQLRRIVQEGDPTPLGPSIIFSTGAKLNDLGEVVFTTELSDGRWAIFRDSNGTIRPVIASGRSSPIGGRYAAVAGNSLNNRGDIAFYGTLTGSSAPSAIFLLSDGRTTKVVAHGDPSPVGGTFDLSFPPDFVLNDRGELVFRARVSIEGQPAGIFLLRAGQLQKIALQNGPSPVGGTLSSVFYPDLNNQGQVSFWASLSRTSARGAVFLWQEGTLRKVVAQGDPTPVGGTYDGTGAPRLNSQGHVMFGAPIAGTAAKFGVFVASPTETAAVAVSGQSSPVGGVYKDFGVTLGINDRGAMAFVGAVIGGEATEGAFLIQADGPTAVMTTNTVVPDGGRWTGFAVFDTTGQAVNNQGQIAFLADVSGGQGVFLVSDGQTRVPARSGQSWPGVGALTKFGRVGLNHRAEVVVSAEPVGGKRGAYVISQGTARKVVAPGDPAADGGRFEFADFAALNDSGEVAFRAGLSGGAATEGVFLATADGIVELITNAEKPPVGQRFTRFGGVCINTRGEVGFVALIDEEPGGPKYRGVFVGTRQGTRKVYLTGDAAPGGGTFASMTDEFSRRPDRFDLEPSDKPSINANGEVAFCALVRQGPPGGAIFLATVDGLRRMVAGGENTPVGGQYNSFGGDRLSLNQAGQIVFGASVREGPVLQGLFVISGGVVYPILSDRTLSPVGNNFTVPLDPHLSDQGTIVFGATHSQGASPQALYIAKPR
jgi:hypothetical protein